MRGKEVREKQMETELKEQIENGQKTHLPTTTHIQISNYNTVCTTNLQRQLPTQVYLTFKFIHLARLSVHPAY